MLIINKVEIYMYFGNLVTVVIECIDFACDFYTK